MRRLHLARRAGAVTLALCLCPWFGTAASAAPPAPAWATTLPIDVRTGSVAVDGAGDVYVTGVRGTDDTAAVLEKLGPDGSHVWTRAWAQHEAHADGELVAVAADGSVYFAGTIGSLHFEGGAWFLRKYAADGTLEWARAEPSWRHGRTADHPTGLAVSKHQVLLAGSYQGCCGDFRSRDGWVLAFDTDGHRRWRSPFEAAGLGAFSDEADGIAVAPGGTIYVAGWAALGPESEEVAAPHELFLQALDPGGNVVWSRTYPATAWIDQDFDANVAVQGRALIVSAFVDGSPVEYPGAHPGHAWLGRFTLGGALRWSRTWGAAIHTAADPIGLAMGDGGRIHVVGTRRDPSDKGLDGSLRAYSSSGKLLWKVRLPDAARLVQGVGVSWGPSGLAVAAAASTNRFGPVLHADVWSFADH